MNINILSEKLDKVSNDCLTFLEAMTLDKLNAYGTKFIDMFEKAMREATFDYTLHGYLEKLPKEIKEMKKDFVVTKSEYEGTYIYFLAKDVKLKFKREANNQLEMFLPFEAFHTIDHPHWDYNQWILRCVFIPIAGKITEPYKLKSQVEFYDYFFNFDEAKLIKSDDFNEIRLRHEKKRDVPNPDFGALTQDSYIITNNFIDYSSDEAFENDAQKIISSVLKIIERSNKAYARRAAKGR